MPQGRKRTTSRAVSKPISDRELVANVKKKLFLFAKEEFAAKHPLELRLLQLKPQIVFKKGTVLPNLLIKALSQTSYVIYLDYFEEIRFYFYSKDGTNMGASTFPKTPKLLQEMHGKASTLLKLPKLDPLRNFDQDSIGLQNEVKKIMERVAVNYHCSTPEIPIMAVSTKIAPPYSVRKGILKENGILHLNSDIWLKKQHLSVILREIFGLFTNLDSDDEIVQLIGMVWAIMYNQTDFHLIKEHLLQERKIGIPIAQKFNEWLIKVFSNKIDKESLDLNHFGSFIFQVGNIIGKNHFFIMFNKSTFLRLFLFWLMKRFESFAYDSFLKMDISLQNYLIFFELAKIQYENEVLLHQYQISESEMFLTDGSLFQYFLSIYSLKANQIEISYIKPPFNTEALKKYEKYENLFCFLDKQELLIFIQEIPSDLKVKYEKEIRYLIFELFTHSGIQINSNIEENLKVQEKYSFEVTVKLLCDWILYEIQYYVVEFPKAKLNCHILSQPSSKILDTSETLKIQCLSSEYVGESQISLGIEFQDPFTPEKRSTITLKTWKLKIIN